VAWGFLCNALLGDKFSIFWPFHKEPWLRTLFHFAMGNERCDRPHIDMHTLQPRSSSCGRERERERGSCACIIWFHMHLLCALCAGTAFCQAVVFQSLALYFRSPYTLPLPVLQQSMGLHGGTDGSA
jgi:hypothetical protein